MTSKFSIDNRELLQRISSGEAVVGIDFGNLIVRELAAFRLAAMDSEPVAVTGNGLNVALSLTQMQIDWICNTCASIYNTRNDDVAQGYINEIRATLERLAAMDSEPVAEVYQTPNVGICAALGPSIRMLCALEPGTKLYRHAQPAPVVPENCVTAEHRRVIEMLLNVCGAAFELADDSCQQDVDGEECHVVPSDAFQKLSDALDEIENTLPTEDIDRPDVFLAWSAMPRAALKSLLHAQPAPVVPELRVDWQENEFSAGWNACRAAMLAAAQQEGK